MATMNPFDLLGDDDTGEISVLIAAQQKAVAAATAAAAAVPAKKGTAQSQAKSAKLPSKPLPPAQAEVDHQQKSASSRKSRISVIAARLHAPGMGQQVDALIAYGHEENVDGVLVDDNLNEPTMGEKLASLNLVENGNFETHESQEREESSPPAKPPTAAVTVLLKQALHADDRALLLDCLYTQDEKVITNSVSQLNPSDVLKLLQSLISIIQSRGAVLACALPWIKNLLLQHSSGIMSQQSSLLALNSLYQPIESRVSTFESALQISSCLDLLYAGFVEDEFDENATAPVIFEDKDESDEEESEDAMETDQESEDGEALDGEVLDGVSDFEGFDDMSE
ncbi:Small-subunit processome, Utp12 [Corchorus capsularis]|uniref:Small-subunit processome, Utp12 n=1 Tax=Corchorus capsularis TaxID=210143 RepID=A0A1R3H2D9_COCAP|nr:Small-subunit processome, Utp12 [Corchorus capsularis]